MPVATPNDLLIPSELPLHRLSHGLDGRGKVAEELNTVTQGK